MICDTCKTSIAILSVRWVEGEHRHSAFQCTRCASDATVTWTGTPEGDRVLASRRAEPIEPGLLFASLMLLYADNALTPEQASNALRFAGKYRSTALENLPGL